MARTYTCDGCGSTVYQPKVIGVVIKRDYCEECSKNAAMFLASEEDARAHYRQRFAEVRAQLISVHGQDGKFKLPDVP